MTLASISVLKSRSKSQLNRYCSYYLSSSDCARLSLHSTTHFNLTPLQAKAPLQTFYREAVSFHYLPILYSAKRYSPLLKLQMQDGRHRKRHSRRPPFLNSHNIISRRRGFKRSTQKSTLRNQTKGCAFKAPSSFSTGPSQKPFVVFREVSRDRKY